ncbi:MAG TPA: hypothetical protein VIK88_03575 [Candidatus Bathyarchaeia archaeon]|jgi:hypothetical protein
MARTIATASVRLPRKVIEELYDASVRFASVLETLEVLMDKQTMRRIKTGEKEYSRRQYVVAKGPAEIRRALSS